MKKVFVLLLALAVFTGARAQKKEIAQAQTYIKSGKDLDKAEASMRTLLRDSANRANMKVWLALTEAVKKQYEQGNEKLYLKQKYDTTALFVTGRNMFLAYEAMDSLDAMPDKKGRVEPRYRKRNALFLDGYRKNLYSGGLFFISKQKFQDAFGMLDTYLDCASQPIFTGYKYDTKDATMLSAAYLATYCGVRLHDNRMAEKYSATALLYPAGRENTMRFLAEIYKEENRTGEYRDMLRRGVDEFPKSEYFFTRLVDYYNDRNLPDSAMDVAARAIAKDSLNTLFLYAKANILLNTGRYEDCAAVCDRIISLNDSVADAYYTAGLAYMNLAIETGKQGGKGSRNAVKGFYSKALPYMERYRLLAPDMKDKWAVALYNIYLNLNMGKNFEEISKML